jgi:hypothetical protein
MNATHGTYRLVATFDAAMAAALRCRTGIPDHVIAHQRPQEMRYALSGKDGLTIIFGRNAEQR